VARQGQKRRDILTDRRADSVQLEVGTARLTLLSGLGGSIGAFTLRDHAILRPTPDEAVATANVRLASCYPLVPYSNRIRDARLAFDGRTFTLVRNFGDSPHSIHGVGWQRPWTVQTTTPRRATLTLDHRATGDDAHAWPWPFRAAQTFDLASDDDSHAALTATLTIENIGEAPFPFGLGWHPFFPRDRSTALQFDASKVWLNNATELPVAHIEAEGDWSFREPRPFGVETLDNVFTGFGGRATLRSDERGIATTIEADSACRCLVVYAPAGRDFAAVEPVTHETDAFNRAAAGASNTGLRVLAPGTAYSCTMRITASIASSP
jgi:aldose 1-epimerase